MAAHNSKGAFRIRISVRPKRRPPSSREGTAYNRPSNLPGERVRRSRKTPSAPEAPVRGEAAPTPSAGRLRAVIANRIGRVRGLKDPTPTGRCDRPNGATKLSVQQDRYESRTFDVARARRASTPPATVVHPPALRHRPEHAGEGPVCSDRVIPRRDLRACVGRCEPCGGPRTQTPAGIHKRHPRQTADCDVMTLVAVDRSIGIEHGDSG
jgi:hypothetical protein